MFYNSFGMNTLELWNEKNPSETFLKHVINDNELVKDFFSLFGEMVHPSSNQRISVDNASSRFKGLLRKHNPKKGKKSKKEKKSSREKGKKSKKLKKSSRKVSRKIKKRSIKRRQITPFIARVNMRR